MSKREAFLLRTDPKVLDALRRWADDELRSVNAQLDFVLRSALRKSGRLDTSRLVKTQERAEEGAGEPAEGASGRESAAD